MPASAASLDAALRLSPHFEHLNSKALPKGYAPFKGQDKKYAVLESPIEKSENDQREYRMIRLENGLEALLCSDPTTDKAAAALNVRVGHLSDPVELQGLAHFCEHLLFMGTEKYPKENEYSEYLAENSGSSNAFTGMDETNYHFDVHPSALDGALDRFAQFFISPLFDASCTEREIQAVDSENKKNLQSDMWRLFQLEKSLSSKNHAYWRFGTGNLDSLWTLPRAQGLDPREELLKFHRKYYSANLFKLAVLGKGSLDELATMVVDKFAEAKNADLPPPMFDSSPFDADQLKQNIFVKTIKDIRVLELTFPMPDQDAMFNSKPGNFLAHFIGHEGQGSILSYLKAKGWANGMHAGPGMGATGFGMFKINVDLTKEGLENYDAVALTVFKYINLLKTTPPQEWAFKEVSMLSEIAFKYQEKFPPMSYVTAMASWLQKPYPRDQVLSAPVIASEFNRDQIAGSIAKLDVSNCRVLVGSQAPVDGLVYSDKEKWYGTQYTIQPLRDTLLKGIESQEGLEDLKLPPPNSFVPSNLDIIDQKEVKEPTRRPTLAVENESTRLWHKKDDRWWIPKASTHFLLKSPLITESAQANVMARLYVDLVVDSLTEYSYDADLAGLSYDLHAQLGNFVLSVDGYNDKLPVLHKVVLDRLTNLTIDTKRFELIKEQLQRGLENFKLGNPYQHASYHLSHLTVKDMYTPEEQLAALPNITAESLRAWVPKVLARSHVEGLVYGNIVKNDAVKLLKDTEGMLNAKPLTMEERLSARCLVPPTGNYLMRRPVQDPGQLNSAVISLYYIGDDADPVVRTRTALLGQLASEPAFDQLRTKEQLGYIVQASPRASIGFVGFQVLVQSERDADHIDSRIENWLVVFKEYLEKMSEEEFAKQRQSLVNRRLEDVKNMGEEVHQYWQHVQSGYYDFGRKRRDAEVIKSLTKEDLLSFYSQYMEVGGSKRSKLSVHLRSSRLNVDMLEVLLATLKEQSIPLPTEAEETLKQNPTYDEVTSLLTPILNSVSEAKKQAVLSIIQSLQLPKLKEGVQEITSEWRDSLPIGPPSQPVNEFQAWKQSASQ